MSHTVSARLYGLQGASAGSLSAAHRGQSLRGGRGVVYRKGMSQMCFTEDNANSSPEAT